MDDGSVYFEDLAVGACFVSDEEPVDRAEMLAYGRRNDPEDLCVTGADGSEEACR
jgi:hypothetical protein